MADAFGATMAVLIFVTILVAGGVYYIVHTKKQRELEEAESRRRNVSEVRAIISSKISDIAELSTVKEEFAAQIFYEDAKEWRGIKLPLTGVKFCMTYSGVIVCGCDLTLAEIPENSITENSAKIILPQSRVLHMYPKVDSYKIINQESSLFANKITLEQQNMLVTSCIEKEKDRLIQEGILTRADENVGKILRAQLRAVGITPQIIFLNSGAEISSPPLLN